jgi:hypothetical protein
MTSWYILCSFGTFFPVLVSCTMKNLATPGKRRKLQVKPEEKLDFRRGDLEQGGQIGRIFAQRGIVWAVFFWCDV